MSAKRLGTRGVARHRLPSAADPGRADRLVRAARTAPAARHRHAHRQAVADGLAAASPRRASSRPPLGDHRQRRARRFPRHALDRQRRARASSSSSWCRSADWSDGVVFVNGHGGNLDAVDRRRRRRCAARGGGCCAGGRASPGGDCARRPHRDVVDARDRTRTRARRRVCSRAHVEPIVTLLPRLRTDGVAAVSANGVLGDPTGASAAEGRQLLDGTRR